MSYWSITAKLLRPTVVNVLYLINSIQKCNSNGATYYNRRSIEEDLESSCSPLERVSCSEAIMI